MEEKEKADLTSAVRTSAEAAAAREGEDVMMNTELSAPRQRRERPKLPGFSTGFDFTSEVTISPHFRGTHDFAQCIRFRFTICVKSTRNS